MQKYKSQIIATVIILITLLSFQGCYNGLVSDEEKIAQAWADVEADYQRRMDIITKFAQVAITAVNKESKAYKEIMEARAKATSINLQVDKLDDESMAKFEEAQRQCTSALNKLMVVHENYPELQSMELFKQLNIEIEGAENRIKESRLRYNRITTKYNTKLRQFPGNLIAQHFGFQSKPLFKADPEAAKSPKLPDAFYEE